MFDLGDSLPGLNFDAPQELSTNLESFDVRPMWTRLLP